MATSRASSPRCKTLLHTATAVVCIVSLTTLTRDLNPTREIGPPTGRV
jgi:hypothetical protein